MTAIPPDDFAAMFRFDLESDDKLRPRSLQSDSGTIGISEIGWCREYARRILTRAPKTDSPSTWAAMVGTYIDEGVEKARRSARPHIRLKPSVTVTLPLPTGDKMIISGTGDEADPTEPAYTDVKTKSGLALARRHWKNETRYRWQRHLVYAGLREKEPDVFTEDGIVRNIVLDRSGKEEHPFVWQESYDPGIVNEAGEWMGDVIYAIANNEEAPKDVEGSACQRFCPFYTACRGSAVVTGPITTPRLAEAVDAYGDADLTEKEGKAVKEELRPTVSGVTGYTERYTITSTTIASNGSTRITVKPR